MGRVASSRVSFAPLLAASGSADARTPSSSPSWGNDSRHDAMISSPLTSLAELCGVEIRQVHRWKRDGIRVENAEDAATALGLHPVAIWGDEWLYAVLCPLAQYAAASALSWETKR